MTPESIEKYRKVLKSWWEDEEEQVQRTGIDELCDLALKGCAAPEAPVKTDPGTEKILRDLLDRIYKMNLMAIPSLHVTEQNPDSNDPLVAWMSDVRSILYRNQPAPDPLRDLTRSNKPAPQSSSSK